MAKWAGNNYAVIPREGNPTPSRNEANEVATYNGMFPALLLSLSRAWTWGARITIGVSRTQ